jgi:hypothetical protein
VTPAMPVTNRFCIPRKDQRPGIFFILATSSLYSVSEWIKYELALTPTSPPQSLPVRMIEWGPTLLTQIFAWAAILGTIVLVMRTSGRLIRKPSQCASSSRFGRIIGSCSTGVLAISVYFLGFMAIFALWNLTSWTYQVGIVVGMQYPLLRVSIILIRCCEWLCADPFEMIQR